MSPANPKTISMLQINRANTYPDNLKLRRSSSNTQGIITKIRTGSKVTQQSWGTNLIRLASRLAKTSTKLTSEGLQISERRDSLTKPLVRAILSLQTNAGTQLKKFKELPITRAKTRGELEERLKGAWRRDRQGTSTSHCEMRTKKCTQCAHGLRVFTWGRMILTEWPPIYTATEPIHIAIIIIFQVAFGW